MKKNKQASHPAHIPHDQEWSRTKEWQEMEREADEDIATGRASGPFTSPEEFMKSFKG